MGTINRLLDVSGAIYVDELREDPPNNFSLVLCAVFELQPQQVEQYRGLEDTCIAAIVKGVNELEHQHLLYVATNNKELSIVDGVITYKGLTSSISSAAIYSISKKKYFPAIVVNKKKIRFEEYTALCINTRIAWEEGEATKTGIITDVIYQSYSDLFEVYKGTELELLGQLEQCREEDVLFIQHNPDLLYVLREPLLFYEVNNNIVLASWRVVGLEE